MNKNKSIGKNSQNKTISNVMPEDFYRSAQRHSPVYGISGTIIATRINEPIPLPGSSKQTVM